MAFWLTVLAVFIGVGAWRCAELLTHGLFARVDRYLDDRPGRRVGAG